MPKLSTSLLIFNTIASFAGSIITSITTKDYKIFILIIDITYFYKVLVIFIVIYNIAFLVIKSKYFKELLLTYLVSIFELFLINVSNTIKY